MSSEFGRFIKTTVFGESHGEMIGMVIDNLPHGFSISKDKIAEVLLRRRGENMISTARREPDEFKIVSGILNGKTTGTPLCCIIENKCADKSEYNILMNTPRPSHADFAANSHFGGMADLSGGGHFSGRLTAPLTVAGSIACQILETQDIKIIGHILSVGGQRREPLNLMNPVGNAELTSNMRKKIMEARENDDSVGGIVQIAVIGLQKGIGSPIFGGIENVISAAVFGVGGVKGIEFGSGFDVCDMLGSDANDQMYYDESGNVKTYSNHNGGITGGFSNGMPIIFSVAVKPTPSIAKTQKTVDLSSKMNTEINVAGRHDPCIVPRALPVIEGVTALAILDLMRADGVI